MNYRNIYEKWLNDPAIDNVTKAELQSIENNPKEIEDRFYRELDFGTGGMRGVLGAGTNRLNIYTIRKATQGLANYILEQAEKAVAPLHEGSVSGIHSQRNGRAWGSAPLEIKVAIAHDCRHMSPEFSKEAALVLNANGIKTYVFDSLRPTPLLSFAVRHLGCISGIVITASHNPPEYNGYKVYWQDGGQCAFPRDEAIIAEVQKVKDFNMIKTIPEADAIAAGLFNVAAESVDDAFLQNVMAQCQNPDIIPASDIKIVYTPLHGAGNISVQRALKEAGFKNVYVVPEQEQPDGNFPTVAYPNPEDSAAFTHAIELARQKDADIVIATDPDCDRVGVVVKHDGDYVLLNGNMTGVILADYIVSQMREKNKLPANGVIVSTIVSTDMVQAIAEENGLTYMAVLTGFKYIGEKIKEFEETGSHSFIFGYEESYGYLAGTYSRDKDGVVATLLACEAAAFYRKQGMSLYDALQKLYEKYGCYAESTESITLKGVEGVENIKKIMATLRQNPPTSLAGAKIVEVRDYLQGAHVTGLPVSDVLYYVTEDCSWACIRPSGTEPKIKIYFGTKCEGKADAKLAYLTKDMLNIVDGVLK